MANANNPFGFMPLTSASGSTGNFDMIYRSILYSDTTKIYRGDPVKSVTAGYVAQWSAATDVGNLAGIFWGCHYLSTALGQVVFSQFWPGADVASTAQNTIYAHILPINTGQPSKFVVQSDSTGTAFADIGANVEVSLGTGSTVTGQSGAYIVATPAATATLPFRIVDLYGSASMGAFGGGGVSGVFPGATVGGVANPYGGSYTGAYNWVIVQGNITSTGLGLA